jgi:hypothetical protein
MTDPRYTDPRDRDPQFSEPVSRRDQRVGNFWGWIAGIAVVVLIAFILIAGWNSNKNLAGNAPPATIGSATRTVPPPTTTGQGAPMPIKPATPAPPAPAPSGK